MSNRVRFPELDLLRCLAAVAVMLFHYLFRGPADHCWPASFPLLGQIFKYGYLGVNVFFLLSGFVILLTAYEKDAVDFTVARIIRLYPAYWFSVTLTASVLALCGFPLHHISLPQYLTNLTMVHSFLNIPDVSGVYWSLAVELKFYFLIFLILLARQIHNLSALLGAWLVASLLLSLRAPHGIAVFFLFPEWSSYFIAGAMFFLIHRQGINAYKILVIAGCYGLSVAYALRILPLGESGPAALDVSAPVLVTLLTLFYLIFFAIALRKRHPQSSNAFYVVGLITYPLYLLHQDLGYVLLRWAAPVVNHYVLVCAAMAAMIALAWLVNRGPERWLALALHNLLTRRNRVAPSVPALSEAVSGLERIIIAPADASQIPADIPGLASSSQPSSPEQERQEERVNGFAALSSSGEEGRGEKANMQAAHWAAAETGSNTNTPNVGPVDDGVRNGPIGDATVKPVIGKFNGLPS